MVVTLKPSFDSVLFLVVTLPMGPLTSMRESASISSLPIASIGLKIGGNDIIDIKGDGPPNDIGDIGDGWKGPGPPAGI